MASFVNSHRLSSLIGNDGNQNKGEIIFSSFISLQILEVTEVGNTAPGNLLQQGAVGFSEDSVPRGVMPTGAGCSSILRIAEEMAKPISICLSQNSAVNRTRGDTQWLFTAAQRRACDRPQPGLILSPDSSWCLAGSTELQDIPL